jgi:hypothetical protein
MRAASATLKHKGCAAGPAPLQPAPKAPGSCAGSGAAATGAGVVVAGMGLATAKGSGAAVWGLTPRAAATAGAPPPATDSALNPGRFGTALGNARLGEIPSARGVSEEALRRQVVGGEVTDEISTRSGRITQRLNDFFTRPFGIRGLNSPRNAALYSASGTVRDAAQRMVETPGVALGMGQRATDATPRVWSAEAKQRGLTAVPKGKDARGRSKELSKDDRLELLPDLPRFLPVERPDKKLHYRAAQSTETFAQLVAEIALQEQEDETP